MHAGNGVFPFPVGPHRKQDTSPAFNIYFHSEPASLRLNFSESVPSETANGSLNHLNFFSLQSVPQFSSKFRSRLFFTRPSSATLEKRLNNHLSVD